MKEPLYTSEKPDNIVALSIMPIIKAQTWCFGIFNLLLGIGLYDLHPVRTLIVANAPWTFKIWSVVFVSLGIAMIVAILKKKAVFLRSLILVSIFVKVTWFAALILRINDNGTFFFAAIWGLTTALQLVQYFYYFSEKTKTIL